MTQPASDAHARLAAFEGPMRGHVFELVSEVDDEPWSLGRGRGNRLILDDPSLSRRHCSITFLDGHFRLRDLDSHNGTFVNGFAVHDHPLADGDQIRAGHSVFHFLLNERGGRPELPSVHFGSDRIENPTVFLPPGHVTSLPQLSEPEAYQALLRVAGALHANRGVSALAGHLLETLIEIVPARRAALILAQTATEEPSLIVTLDRHAGPGAHVEINRAAVDRVLREGASVLSGTTYLAAPLLNGEKSFGVIYLDGEPTAGGLREEHLRFASAVGAIAGPALTGALEFSQVADENRRLSEEIRVRHEMVGECPAMEEVYRLIARVAPASSTVLILGETGTGKELVARAIHRNSPRANAPFVAINCAALTESLLESELFGHERGAFTGAVTQKRGKLEVADQGTVFLDEVGDLPATFQTKLLRVLQEREFERVGGTRPIRVDIRILAATNRDLRAAINGRTFREDLYYRLNVVAIRLPALRDRREDIPLLANYFLEKRAGAVSRRISGISGRAQACLMNYDWPGNIRELEHAIESAIVVGEGKLIDAEDLPEAILEGAPAGSLSADGYHGTLKHDKCELILAAIERAGGNITEAARQLKLHPNYLHRLIRNLNLRGRIGRPRA
ncbi:sigma 54-interacting transcriptional regulator [Paludibaculum fermentans]|uniref:sigma 54-interacting transcriptional regulator n=1 Tax=Paludibaculum fermentans TaxID=1473598 RepID=UPI003EB93212